MAGNLQRRGFANLGKRLVDRSWTGLSYKDPAALSSSRRGNHVSAYDKNPDEPVHPTVLPDDVIQTQSSDKYWAPHPKTGVFGPGEQNGGRVDPEASRPPASGSVLEETAWFRPLEDVGPAHAEETASGHKP